MASMEEMYAAMATGSPESYRNVAFPDNQQLTSEYGALVNPSDSQVSPYYENVRPSQTLNLITNIPSLQPSAKVYIEPPPVAAIPSQQASQNQGSGDFIADYDSKILAAPDFISKQRLINEFADVAQTRMGNAQQAALKGAEQDLNIPPQRKLLQDMIQNDTKNHALEGRDSPETAKQRATVLKLEELASKKAEDILKNSAAFSNFSSRVKNSLSLQSKMAEKAFNDAEKLAQKEETRRDNAQILSSSVDMEARKAINTFNPNMKDDVVFADWVMKGGGKSKDWQPILTGQIQSGDYLSAAIEGNGAARQLAASEYSARTGKSHEESIRTIQQAEMLARSPELFASTAAKLGIMPPAAAKDFVAKYNIASSSDRKEMNKVIMTKIPDIMEASTINYVKSDPTAVATTLNDPAFVEAGAKTMAKNPGQKPSTYDISLTYINDPTISNAQRLERQEKVTAAYAQSLAKEGSNGILHIPFDKGRISAEAAKFKQSLTAKTVSDTLAAKIGQVLGRAAEGASNLLPSQQLYNVHEAQIKGFYGMADEFMAGVTNRNK